MNEAHKRDVLAEVALKILTRLGCSAYGDGPGLRGQLTFNLPAGVSVTEVLDLLVEFSHLSGTPGAAAKESPVDIAAPGGATIGDRLDYLDRWQRTHTDALGFLARRVEVLERYLGSAALDYARSLPPEGHQSDPPPCPDCQRPMARVSDPRARRSPSGGWTCVNCNAAGDPEEDLVDPDPCGCDETVALKAEVRDLRKCLTWLERSGGLELPLQRSIRKVLGPHREGDH